MPRATKTGREEGIQKGLQEGMEKGIERGLEQGLEKGKAEATQQIVLKLAGEGMPIEIIMVVTGLTKVEIEQVLKKEEGL